jgi:hypothetical protein
MDLKDIWLILLTLTVGINTINSLIDGSKIRKLEKK